MAPIRVLIVDDAVVVRRMLSDVVDAEPDLEVAGTASNGRIGIQKVELLNPDVVTLDVEMPELDGLATLREIRRVRPRLPVIMFSTLTERGAGATLDALAAGASDYVTKPSNVGSARAAIEAVRSELVPRIRALANPSRAVPAGEASEAGAGNGSSAALTGPRPRPLGAGTRPRVVVVGVSTGGPSALEHVLVRLPASLDVPVLVVQHMPPVFTRLLAERLDTKALLGVVEAGEGMSPAPGQVYIAPGGSHLTVEGDETSRVLALDDGPPENSCRPAVDKLFRSVASCYGAASLGVILTGMGQDGLVGSRHLVEAGGEVIVQDEATSVVWGMPGAVARAGLAAATLPLELIAPAIAARCAAARTVSQGTIG